jgi:hypothetical protein
MGQPPITAARSTGPNERPRTRLFTGARQIDPIWTVADRRQVNLDGAQNGGAAHRVAGRAGYGM